MEVKGEVHKAPRPAEVVAGPLSPVLKVQTPKKQSWDRPVSEGIPEREQDRAHTQSEDSG